MLCCTYEVEISEMKENLTLPEIDYDRCTLCGLCVDYCPTGAVEFIQGHPVITSSGKCTYCGICEDLCPVGAVELVYEIISGN